MYSITRIMNRKRKENEKSLSCILLSFFYFKYIYQTAHCKWYHSKHSAWRPITAISAIKYQVLLHPGNLHHRCEPLAIQWLIPSSFEFFAGWGKLWLAVDSVVNSKVFLYRQYYASIMPQRKLRHPVYILQDLTGIGDIFGKHYCRPHQQ